MITRYGDTLNATADTSRNRTPAIWYDVPIEEIMVDPMKGSYLFDDFKWGINTGKTPVASGPYDVYGDTGVIFRQEVASQSTGVVELTGNDADNDEGVLATGPMALISDAAANARKVVFEARVNVASITDEAIGWFVGLGYDAGSFATCAQTTCLTDDEADLQAWSFLGFHVDLSDCDALDWVYRAEGQAQTVKTAGFLVPVVDTWYKLGFRYDPDFPSSKRIKVYLNGVEQASSAITATEIATATFPDEEAMGMVFAGKVGTAAAVDLRMDWWGCAMWGDVEI